MANSNGVTSVKKAVLPQVTITYDPANETTRVQGNVPDRLAVLMVLNKGTAAVLQKMGEQAQGKRSVIVAPQGLFKP